MAQRAADDGASPSESSGVVECRGSFSLHEAFKQFSGEVPAKQLPCRSSPRLLWRWFEVGSAADPLLILLHGVCGSAANFFQQLSLLRDKGFHVVSLQWPAFASLNSFLCGLDEFVAGMHARDASTPTNSSERGSGARELHIMGSELGGLLALHYAAMRPQLVKSVILCNSFVSADLLWKANSSFRAMVAPFLSVLPHAALRKVVISHFLRPLKPVQVPLASRASGASNEEECHDLQRAFCSGEPSMRQCAGCCDDLRRSTRSETEIVYQGTFLLPQESLEVKNSKEFLIAQLDHLSAADMASRLSLSLSVQAAEYVPQLDDGERLLILHTLDSGLPPKTEEAIKSVFPKAKVATMRTGGPFPFLAAADEVSMHIELHMRRCGAAKNRQMEAARAPQQLESGQQNHGWKAAPSQTERGSSAKPTIDSPWQRQQRTWDPAHLSNAPQSNTDTCTISAEGVGSREPWCCSNVVHQQQTHKRADKPAYWDNDDHSPREQTPRDLLAYPRKLSHPLLDSERNTVWGRTAGSCSSSSQSSFDSSDSTGNPGSLIGSRRFMDGRAHHPSTDDPHASGFPY
ncbi:hypothetical protein Esti_005736 [Eimeria stiedai]